VGVGAGDMVANADFGEESMELLVFASKSVWMVIIFLSKRWSTSFWNSTNLENTSDLNFNG
jgi:hypothetical protein